MAKKDLDQPLLLVSSQDICPVKSLSDGPYEFLRDAGEGEEHGNSWVDSMVIIIANVMGIGVLGLAHAFAKLGMLWGLLVLTIAISTSVYSGMLLSRMKCKFPHVEVYADLGYEAFGNLGKTAVTIIGYAYIIGICFSFQLSASIAMKEVTDGLCFVYCSLLVAAVVVPLAQYRNLEELNWMAYIGAFAIAFPIIIILFEITVMGRYEKVIILWVTDEGFNSAFIACMTVIFAITGQVIFIEIMSEMKNPQEFKKSIYGASSVFAVVYNSMAILGYCYIGSKVLNPITDNLTDKTSRRWCSAFVFCHVIVAYVMQVIVLARAFEHLVLKKDHEDSKHASHKDRITWLIITTVIVFVSFLVCNLIPFINDLMGFVGAISGVTTTYVFPFLFAPILLQDEMSTSGKKLHQAFAAFSAIVAVYGVYASLQQMVGNFQSRSPFSC